MTQCKRGRPKGSGIDDTVILYRIAELLIAHPGLKPTTAMKQLGKKGPSELRRLQIKWRREKEAYITAARRKLAQQKKYVPLSISLARIQFVIGQSTRSTRQLQKVLNRHHFPMQNLKNAMQAAMGPSRQIVQSVERALAPTREFVKAVERIQYPSKQIAKTVQSLNSLKY